MTSGQRATGPLLTMLSSREFWRHLLVTVLFFGLLARMQFVVEAYAFYGGGRDTAPALFVTHGRFIPAVEWWIFKGLCLPDWAYYYWSILAAVFCTAASLYVLERFARAQCLAANRYLVGPVAVLILINPFLLDLVLWTQKSTQLLAVLACVLAVAEFLPVMDGQWSRMVRVWAWLMAANFAYQGPLALFPCLALVYICTKSRDWRGFLANHVLAGLAFGVPVVVNYAILRFVLVHQRVTQPVVWSETLLKVQEGFLETLFNTFGVLPRFLFAGFLGLVFVFVMVQVLGRPRVEAPGPTPGPEGRRGRGPLLEGLAVLYLLLGSLAAAMSPHMGVASDIIWVVPRNVYAAGCVPGLLLLYLLNRREIRVRPARILVLGLCLYLGVLNVCLQRILVDHYTLNRMDAELAVEIRDRVRAYEAASGIKVTRLAIYLDANREVTYRGLFWNRDTNMRALGFEEGTVDILKYLTDLDLQLVPGSRQIRSDFSRRDWGRFSVEQMKFVGDTLHLCLF